MFSERLKQLRTEYNLTLEDVGNKLSVHRSTISSYESGTRTPDIKMLQKLSDLFGVSTDYLLGKSDEREVTYSIASYSGIKEAMKDMSEDDINEVKRFIEFIKSKHTK